jgi:drug/metabolite transporter (DMT)-like permease
MTAPRPNNPLLGAAWMIGAGICFTVMIVCVRYLAARLPAGDIVFYRAAFGLALTIPFLFSQGASGVPAQVRTKRLPLFALRGLFTYGATLTYFYAVTKIPIADAVALNSTIPIFTVTLAALILRERVTAARWAVVALGFAGALLIIRPGFAVVHWAALAALVSAVLYASAGICIKLLSRTEPAKRVVLYMNLILTLLAAIPFAMEGLAPLARELPFILAIGASGTLAHYCSTNANKAADASFIAPFDFCRLLLVALAGVVLFAENPSTWVWIGGALIAAAAIFLARSEARRIGRDG